MDSSKRGSETTHQSAGESKKTAIGVLFGRCATAGRKLAPGGGEGLLAVLVGILLGIMTVVGDPIILFGGVAVTVVLMVIYFKDYKVFWYYLISLLIGYLLLGKGFAYLGAAPVYVGEIGLALAAMSLFVLLATGRFKTGVRLFRPEVAFLLLFVAWQALCTVPYLKEYGVDAARDAAVWGYAAFALFILLLVPRESVKKLFVVYGKVLPYLLVWLLVAYVLIKVAPTNFRLPGSPVPLLHLKAGDVGVHLAGAAAFMLLRLDLRSGAWSSPKLWFIWGLWLANWAAWSAGGRAGMFSALAGVAVAILWRPRTAQWYRPVVVATLLALLFVAGVSGPSLSENVGRNKGVSISGEQIVTNITSTFSEDSEDTSATLQGTKEWRMNWWTEIVGYTFGGEYFWTGKGYGINLANADGFQTDRDTESLRSPHNVFMTILARSGVPGLALWLLFLIGFGAMLARRALVRRSGDSWDKRYAVWLMAYWLAFLVNAGFDVFLEGPMGGILFWSLIGLSLVYFGRDTREAKYLQDEHGAPESGAVRGAIHTARPRVR